MFRRSRGPTGGAWQRYFLYAFACLCLALALGYVAVRFIQYERASYALPRLFIQLERSIGYDGFIHNFKNYVLRPEDETYFEAALRDYDLAKQTLQDIDAIARDMGIPGNLGAVDTTLSTYRAMLDTARDAHAQGLPIRDVDARVRTSDADAAASIRVFEFELLDIMERRRTLFLSLGLSFIGALLVAATVIASLQSRKRRRAEEDNQRLQEQEAFLLQAEHIARLGRWKTDRNGNLTWSQAAIGLSGTSSTLAYRTLEDFWMHIPAPDQATLRKAVDKAVHEKGRFACRHRLERPDGSIIDVVNSGEIILDNDGLFNGIFGTLQDVSSLAAMENELRQAQKMEAIGNLAGGMAHDFNNILAVVLGNLELLEDAALSETESRHVAAAIDATKRGADLTRNMLGFARRSHLEPQILQGNDLIRDVMNWAARLLPANIRIETSLLANLWEFSADEGLAKNALLNLLLNAQDAMPEGGHLTIETANLRIDNEYIEDRHEDLQPGRHVMIAVSDTGCGIDPDKLEKVFEPFYSSKPAGEGTGLGLSMVHGFMKQSGGTVRIYSEPGVGTTVKLYFKAAERAGLFLRDDPGHADLTSLRDRRVLLVEDNPDLLKILEEMLTEAGMTVTAARSGDEALSVWSRVPQFDLVVTDIVMPGELQGTHLAKTIRAMSPSTPFLFMSGYASEAVVHGNGLQDRDIRLMKPVQKQELLSALAKLLR